MRIQNFLIFFFVVGSVGFIYFSYINVLGKSMKNQAKPTATRTEAILKEQSAEIKRLNQDYRDIIEKSKRQSQDAIGHFDHDAISRDYDQALQDNRRQMEDNRRQMEQMRRDMQRR